MIIPGRTRAAIRGFIKRLLACEQGRRNESNPEPVVASTDLHVNGHPAILANHQ